MRRQLIGNLKFEEEYNDTRNLINRAGFAEGSCNQLLLAEGPVPHKGFTSKGTATGSRIAVQLGNTWGGLNDYSSVTANGSLIEDQAKTLYMIGRGKPSKEGSPVQAYATPAATIIVASATDVNTGTDELTEVAHGRVTGDQVRYTATQTAIIVATPALALNTTYFAIVTGVDTFKLAISYANALIGTAIDITGTGTGNQTFTKGEDLTASTLLKVASVQLSDHLYTYFDQAGLARSDAPSLEVPATVGPTYTGVINGAISFKIAGIRDRANTGANITTPDADVKSVASTTSAVVIPANKTVKITFPTAKSGYTHWAVFATKAGFGGTGIHYRVGYRLTSNADAEWIFGIPETTVAAATLRTLEFDFRDGDLFPEEAWLFDYAPPAGTHFVRLENIGVVLGCFDGTIGAVSLPNFTESYHPRHLIYFPEPVTAVLHRQVDNFAYVFCRNSIHVLQYVGYRGDDYPSCTISTISSEVGVAGQSNVASGMGLICAFIEGSGLVLIDRDGSINHDFSTQVAYFTKNWVAANVVVVFDPSTRSFVAGHGTSSVSFSVQTRQWSVPVYLTDYGVSGNWLSGTNTRGAMICSVDNAGSHTAYTYNLGATRAVTVSMSHWMKGPRSLNLYEIEASVRQGNSVEPIILGVHQNLFPTYKRSISVAASSDIITGMGFTSAYTGKQVVLFGTDINGSGVHHIIGKVVYSSATQLLLKNRATGASLQTQATLSNVLMLIGEDFEAIVPTANFDDHLYSFYPDIQDCRSYAASVTQLTDGVTGGVIEVNLFGTGQQTSEAKL